MDIIAKYFLLFISYSVIGWIYETLLCSFTEKKFINRGFFNGPYCPIYGFGALIVIFSLNWTSNSIIIFICSVILTGILEYLTSYFMELLFHARWWDYSTRHFNINGRVCLEGVILFGCFSLLLLKVVNPLFVIIIDMLSKTAIYILSIIIFIAFVTDNVITFVAVACFDDRLKELRDIIEKKREYVLQVANEYKTEASNRMQSVIEKLDIKKINVQYKLPDLRKIALAKLNKQHLRIIKAFPNLKSINHNEVLSNIKESIYEKIHK